MSKQEKDLEQALLLVKNMLHQAVIARLDPWAVRQAIIIGLELGRQSGLDRGISSKVLEDFDVTTTIDARAWAEKHGRRG